MRILTFFREFLEHCIILLPDNRIGISLRCAYWARRLQTGSNPGIIGQFTIIKHPGRIFIGNSSINNFVTIDATCGEEIHIGNNVFIGPYTIVVSWDHNFSDPQKTIREQGYVGGKVRIEDDVWIGAHCIITRDTTIGQGSVIGAGSVVTRDIPPNSVAYGVPARVIRQR
ncbi:MAG TPA: acyltransferase [Methanomicrobiales archaeon]|nr:acyltransferase [Methanomicrobiales archaeon]